ncbi:hypothetical protein DH2020_036323 [Rehmannia glutinosa]|uniref:CSC1-like protein n=1 Tax=Rehmannia glutinosa TaxID=99300 RepID=A0ABR0V759_REHGL
MWAVYEFCDEIMLLHLIIMYEEEWESLKIFGPIAIAAFVVLIPVNFSGGTLFFLRHDLVVSNIDKLSISNIRPKSYKFFVHISMEYLFTFWACYMLYKEYDRVATMRLNFLASQGRRAEQFTAAVIPFHIYYKLYVNYPQVLVRNVPRVSGRSVSDSVDSFFQKNHPDHYLCHQAVYKAKKFAKLVRKRDKLQNWLDYNQLKFERNPDKKPTRKGFLPGLALKVFLFVLPTILMIMSKIEGHVALSVLERRTAAKYYYFMLVNVFLGSIAAGTAFQQLHAFLHQSATHDIPPKNMFIVKTERDLEKAMDPKSIDFPETLPSLQLYFLLGMVYMVVTPILLPFILVFFAFAYFVYRHQVINVYNQKYESAAAFWPHVHGRIIASLLISQLLLMGLLSTKKAANSTPLLVVLPILTLTFHKYCKNRFEPAFRKYPLEEAMTKDAQDRATSEADANFKSYLADAYLHPIFHSFEEVELSEVRVDKNQAHIANPSPNDLSPPSAYHHENDPSQDVQRYEVEYQYRFESHRNVYRFYLKINPLTESWTH